MDKIFNELTKDVNLLPDFLKHLFAAPPAMNAINVDIFSLSLRQILSTLSPEELWQAGNAGLRNDNPILAKKCFIQYLEKSGVRNPKVVSLFALSSYLTNKKSVAFLGFKEALNSDPSLDETRLLFAYLKFKEGNYKSVTKYIDLLKDLKTKRHQSLALFLSALALSHSQKKFNLEEMLKESFSLYPMDQTADYIMDVGFEKGKKLFDKGNIKAATATWNEYYKTYGPEVWARSKKIFNFFQTIQNKQNKKAIKILKVSNEKIAALKVSKKKNSYIQMLNFLITNGLFPEFYESEAVLSERAQYWKEERKKQKVYPYADFRYGVTLAYLGNYTESSDTLYAARDTIPPSKASYFKMDQLIEFLHEKKFNEV